MDAGLDIARLGAAIGQPARAAMLMAMLGGRAMPATELARIARVAPSTASAHLAELAAAGLVTVERHGRHRFHRLASAQVAHAIELLSTLMPPPSTAAKIGGPGSALRAARSCYDHLAGALGVALADRLVTIGALDESSLGFQSSAPFLALGVDIQALTARPQPICRPCLDWTERRPHLGGRLGTAVLDALLEAAWVIRRPPGRALGVTLAGADGLLRTVGLDIGAIAPVALSSEARHGPPARG